MAPPSTRRRSASPSGRSRTTARGRGHQPDPLPGRTLHPRDACFHAHLRAWLASAILRASQAAWHAGAAAWAPARSARRPASSRARLVLTSSAAPMVRLIPFRPWASATSRARVARLDRAGNPLDQPGGRLEEDLGQLAGELRVAVADREQLLPLRCPDRSRRPRRRHRGPRVPPAPGAALRPGWAWAGRRRIPTPGIARDPLSSRERSGR